MTIDQKNIEAEKLNKVIPELIEQYVEGNPHLTKITLVRIIRTAITYLKHYIEDPNDKDISWDSPYLQLNYKVELANTNNRFVPLVVSEDYKDLLKENIVFTSIFRDYPVSIALHKITEGVGFFEDKDNKEYIIFTGWEDEKFRSLSPKQQKRLIESLTKKHLSESSKPSYPPLPLTLEITDSKGKKRRAKMSIIIDFQPLIIKEHTNGEIEAYYPVVIGFHKITGYKPIYWGEENKKEFWEYIDKIFKALAPQESFDSLSAY